MSRLFIALMALCIGNKSVAYEEPRYRVVEVYDDFEVRHYEPHLVAETIVSGEFSEVGGRAFRILADYISGANRDDEKISMTAPVSQHEAARSPAEPALVAESTAGKHGYVFSFFLPGSYTAETAPAPVDPRVTIRKIPGRLMAALKYSGGWSEARYRRHERRLLDALAREGLEPKGTTVFARYNSPFTLWFARRNEVLAPLGGDHAPHGPSGETRPDELPKSDPVLLSFADEEAGLWRSVDDVVMGGVSSSAMRVEPSGTAVFSGEVSLENNGGFASVRAPVGPFDLREFEGLALRVRGDGKTYRLRLHDEPGFGGIAYQSSFATRRGEWQSVRLPFAGFRPTFRGRTPPDAPPLDIGRIQQVGLMIADGQAGPFRLELDRLAAFGTSVDGS